MFILCTKLIVKSSKKNYVTFMKPTHNHESDSLVSFFLLLYLLVSQVKTKFSSILNLKVKSSKETYNESNSIMICDWCCDFDCNPLKLPSSYIPSPSEEIKSSPFVYS